MKSARKITQIILLALIIAVLYIRTDVFIVIYKTLIKSGEFAALSFDSINSDFYLDKENPGTVIRLYKAGAPTEKLTARFFENSKRFIPIRFDKFLTENKKSIKRIITLSGSGTYHHHTLKFIEEMPADLKPEVLYLIDAHSDSRKLVNPDKIDCGNWINKLALNKEKYGISKVIFLGGHFGMSFECDRWLNFKLVEDNFMDVYTNPKKGKAYFKTSFSKKEEERKVLSQLSTRLKYLKKDHVAELFGHPGVWLKWKSLKNFISEEPSQQAKPYSYITIDLDVLDSKYITTEWGNGNLHLAQLLVLLDTIKKHSNVVGVDICGWSGKEEDDNRSINTIKKIYEHIANN